jgi:hypothetical protein
VTGACLDMPRLVDAKQKAQTDFYISNIKVIIFSLYFKH